MATQIATALGARVIVTSSSDDKRRRAEEIGAADTINYRARNVADEVRRLTGGRGADVVIETIGGSNLDVSLDAVRIGGRIGFVGLIAGLTGQVSTYEFVTRNATLHGIETGSRAMLEDLVAFIDAHGIVPVVDSVHPRVRVRQALEHLAAGGHFGKVVISA
jgi:NADPH:quinone reductase-like Zn-dependent oxidoreductase